MATPTYVKHNWVTRELISRDLLNNIEQGIADNNTAILELEQKSGLQVVTGSVTLTNNSGWFPFNKKSTNIIISPEMADTNYMFIVLSATAEKGNIGEINVIARYRNALSLEYTGTATGVTVNYAIIGGA